MSNETFPADSCHLDCAAVVHESYSRSDGPGRKVGVIDRPSKLVKDLLENKLDRLEERSEAIVRGFRWLIEKPII
jgi:hypothetical protein